MYFRNRPPEANQRRNLDYNALDVANQRGNRLFTRADLLPCVNRARPLCDAPLDSTATIPCYSAAHVWTSVVWVFVRARQTVCA